MAEILEIIRTLKKKRPELKKEPLLADLESSALGEEGLMEGEDELAMEDSAAADAAGMEAEEDVEGEIAAALDESLEAPRSKPKKKPLSYLDEEEEEDEGIDAPAEITGRY